MTHSIKIPTATTLFSGSTFLVVVRPISMELRFVLEIQDGSQIAGSTNNFIVFTDTYVVSKPYGLYDYLRNI